VHAPSSSRRLAPLDGLRAVAVVAVVVFHLDPTLLPGGYAGVDVFFVLSGYLITRQLLVERELRGQILLGRFWLRRARRILPALVAMLLVCGSLLLVLRGDPAVGWGRQLLSALTFTSNWTLVADGSDYFAQGSPPVLQNLWSLAVEEQFYLVWPFVLTVVVAVVRRPSARARTVLALALVSAVTAAVVTARSGVSRAYYGSDTHAFGLLAGAALALAQRADARPARRAEASSRPPARGTSAVVGLAGLAALVWLFLRLRGGDGTSTVLGLPVVAVTTAALVASASRTGTPVNRLLSSSALRWLGRRSYGIYLWHWPLLVVLRSRLDEPGPGPRALLLAILTVVLTLVLAGLSWRFVERPFLDRRVPGLVGRGARRAGVAPVRGGLRPTAVVVGVAVAAVASVMAGVSGPTTTAAASQVAAGERALAEAAATSSDAPLPSPTRTREMTPAGPSAPPRGTSSPPARKEHRRAAGRLPDGDRVTAVGDSVMLASAPALLRTFPGVQVDAEVSRMPQRGPDVVRRLAREGRLGDVVVVGLGTNGYLGRGTLDELRSAVGPRRLLVLVTVFVPRPWQDADNDQLRAFARHHPRTFVSDWYAAVRSDPHALGPDGIHPGPTGARLYADTLASTLRAVDRRR